MKFELIEEWGDSENPYKYYTVPVFAGTFATKEEAQEEAKKHTPTHDGIIRVVPAKSQSKLAKQKRAGRKKPRLRESRRDGRRR
jgi:hypothetical protein